MSLVILMVKGLLEHFMKTNYIKEINKTFRIEKLIKRNKLYVQLAAKYDLVSLKAEVDKLDIDK